MFKDILEDRRTVLCHGCFDMLHLGHIRHLQEAKKLGNYLVVSVTADRFVNKGIGRPHFPAEQRAEALRALDCVDEVIINEDEGAWDLIHRLKPSFYVKGVDYIGVSSIGLDKDREAIAAVGGQMRFTGTRKWSSSRLINTEKFTPEIVEYLRYLRELDAKERIFEAFAKADEKSIVYIGETITDVYRYVRGLGRASKELMLATVQTHVEDFGGGVMASYLHGDWENASVVTAGNITKSRYVDADFNRKLLDVYSSQYLQLSTDMQEGFRDALQKAVGASDVVVVNDFGHGLIGQVEQEMLNKARFLAVNCQTNAGNYGYNLITKYPKADYICIDEPEARLAAGEQNAHMPGVVRRLAMKVDCKRWIITHGRFGSHSFDVNRADTDGAEIGFGHHPALTHGGIDTMGAGDAVMAVTAPLIAAGLSVNLAAFVGNIVGAIKVGIVGHRRHVNRDEILRTVEALLA